MNANEIEANEDRIESEAVKLASNALANARFNPAPGEWESYGYASSKAAAQDILGARPKDSGAAIVWKRAVQLVVEAIS